MHTHSRTSGQSLAWSAVALAAALTALASSTVSLGPGTTTTLTPSATATVLDVHGRPDVQTVPPSCLVGAPPLLDAPEAWWQGINPPSVRAQWPVTGYRVWRGPPPVSPCPETARTEVYAGLYAFDLRPWLGRSGGILSARVVAQARATSVSPLFIPEPPLAPPNAGLCDEGSAGLQEIWRVPPAPAVPQLTGFDTVAQNPGNPQRIPDRTNGGSLVATWPGKQPTQRATGQSQRELAGDVGPALIAALQAFEALGRTPSSPPGSADFVFMTLGTNRPPNVRSLSNSVLPFTDCRGAYSLALNIVTP